MRINKIYIILFVLILIILGSFIVSNMLNQKNEIQVGSGQFILPEGYYKGDSNSAGDLTITNGNNSICLAECDGDNITSCIKGYTDFVENQNQTLKFENFTVDNVKIFKSTCIENPSVVHYWFVKNNKVYTIYKGDHNNSTDAIVIDLIHSYSKIN